MEWAPLTHLESSRLTLRRFRDADLVPLLAYRNDPEVARFQAWELPFRRRDALHFIREQQTVKPGTPGRWFHFAVTLRASSVLIGNCGLVVDVNGARQAEIGFSFARAWHGRGLASEAVRELVGYAFSRLGMHRLVAVTQSENTRAIALLERSGFRLEGQTVASAWSRGRWRNECLFALLEAEWNAHHRAA
jgi:RimJ/RimL family protein N-acetyltransferase